MEYTNLEDKKLVELCKGDDELAFGELYTRHFDSVKKILMSKTRSSEHDAEDIVQKSFIKALKGIKNFKGKSMFRTWIHTICHHTFLDSLRTSREIAEESILKLNEDRRSIEAEKKDSPLSILEIKDESREMMKKINNAKGKLSEHQKKVFDLVFVEDKSYSEVAQILQCPIGTVMSRVYFTRRKMKNLLTV
jgi:RNA polymerase sigma-70 factor (ECF subfamily)